ncbi:MAG: N-acetyltransferase [Pseudomonadota bacterium]
MLDHVSSPTVTIAPELPLHAAAIEALNDLTFGPGRFTRAAYRLRDKTTPILSLGRVAMAGARVIGSVQFAPMEIGERHLPALLLGPLCVHPDHANRGYGKALMKAGLEAARRERHELVILVGDAPYYARVGFKPVPRGQITLPGPVDPARLLAFELVEGSLVKAKGEVRAGPITQVERPPAS